jgi:hypothetical protein
MPSWRARGALVIMAAICIALAILVPFLPSHAGEDVLAVGLGLGGIAMLVAALWTLGRNGNGNDH